MYICLVLKSFYSLSCFKPEAFERWHDHGDIVRAKRLNLFLLTTFPCNYWLTTDNSLTTCYGWGCFLYSVEGALDIARTLLSEVQTKGTSVTPWVWLLQTRIGNGNFCWWNMSPLLVSLGKGLHFYLCYPSTFLLLKALEKPLGRREGDWWELNNISQGQGIGQTTEFVTMNVV